MTSKTRRLLEAVFDKEPGIPPDCWECQIDMAAYVDAELAGQDAAALYPAVQIHLVQCNACSQQYEELTALLRLESQGRLEQPPAQPGFDYSFLDQTDKIVESPPEEKPWRLDELGRLIIEFSAELLRSLQEPTVQPSYLKSGEAPPLQFVLHDEVDDLNVGISAEPDMEDPVTYTVNVGVDVPSRGGWPNLAGMPVTLRRGGELMATQATDAFGQAVFEGIAAEDLDRLSFEIAAQEIRSSEGRGD